MFQKQFISSLVLLSLVSFFQVKAFAQTESYVGVGLTMEEVEMKDKETKEKTKGFMITDLIGKAPAERAGARVQDLIRAVDGKSTSGQKLKTVSSWMAGDVGTNVTLTLETIGSEPRDVTMTREVITYECYMTGWVNLSYYGTTADNGSLSGYIGNEYIHWNVFSGMVSGYFKNEFIRLNANVDYTGNIEINGWVRNSNIYWRGYNNNISVFQPCIR